MYESPTVGPGRDQAHTGDCGPVVRRWLRRASFRRTYELETAIKSYLEESNLNPKPFVWTKTADQIL